jgi:4-hydroxy-3-polyprenylbenzoate decarboxylase
MRIIVAICGASGVSYAKMLLEELKKRNIETHVIASDWAKKIFSHEAPEARIEELADYLYDNNDLAAEISSTSFVIDAMVVLPATVKTASDIASAHADNLIARCADNMLRQHKKLIVCIRETPLSAPTLKNLYNLSLFGAIVFPLCPAFYHKPKTIDDMQRFIVGKILDLLGIENNLFKRWKNEL